MKDLIIALPPCGLSPVSKALGDLELVRPGGPVVFSSQMPAVKEALAEAESKRRRKAELKAEALRCKGTIHSAHIEEPERPFFVRVLRAPCHNVLFKPERREIWKVLAQTRDGALRIARYHFHRGSQFEFVS